MRSQVGQVVIVSTICWCAPACSPILHQHVTAILVKAPAVLQCLICQAMQKPSKCCQSWEIFRQVYPGSAKCWASALMCLIALCSQQRKGCCSPF